MPQTETHPDREAERTDAASAFMKADLAYVFGPSFFMGHLGRFVRDRCPDPTENLPIVEIHLVNAETLHICHIIGVAPRWVMLAVPDAASHSNEMALTIVPYETIQRVDIRTRRQEGSAIGFSQTQPPAIITPETLLRAAMAPAAAPD